MHCKTYPSRTGCGTDLVDGVGLFQRRCAARIHVFGMHCWTKASTLSNSRMGFSALRALEKPVIEVSSKGRNGNG